MGSLLRGSIFNNMIRSNRTQLKMRRIGSVVCDSLSDDIQDRNFPQQPYNHGGFQTAHDNDNSYTTLVAVILLFWTPHLLLGEQLINVNKETAELTFTHEFTFGCREFR
jgi:hypothetical protein